MITDLRSAARLLGGEVSGGQILCPGPFHSRIDRSLSVKRDANAPEGFLTHSFVGDDVGACRDMVRDKLGLPGWKYRAGAHAWRYNPSSQATPATTFAPHHVA